MMRRMEKELMRLRPGIRRVTESEAAGLVHRILDKSPIWDTDAWRRAKGLPTDAKVPANVVKTKLEHGGCGGCRAARERLRKAAEERERGAIRPQS